MLPHCYNSQAIWLLCTGAREAAFRNIKSIAECLSDELINAAKVRQDMCHHVVIVLFAGLLQQLRYQEEGWIGACCQVQPINMGLLVLMVDLEMHSIQNPAWKRETICSFMQSCQLLGNAFLLQRLFLPNMRAKWRKKRMRRLKRKRRKMRAR